MGIPEQVTDLLDPVIAAQGAELVDVEWTGGTLRVLVDTEAGITTGELQKVNRSISPILDEEDPIPGRYTLEVSSPGVERRLNRPAHYIRAVGEDVVVKRLAGNEPRRIRGRLVEAAETGFSVEAVEVDGRDLAEAERFDLTYETVDRTKTHFKWGGQPKPNSSSRAKQNKTNHKKTSQNKTNQNKQAKQQNKPNQSRSKK